MYLSENDQALIFLIAFNLAAFLFGLFPWLMGWIGLLLTSPLVMP